MSFILEALKKSDRERKRTQAPDIDNLYSPDVERGKTGGVATSKWQPTRLLVPMTILFTASIFWIGFSVLPGYFTPHPQDKVEIALQQTSPSVPAVKTTPKHKDAIPDSTREEISADSVETSPPAPLKIPLAEKPEIAKKVPPAEETAENEEQPHRPEQKKNHYPLLSELSQSFQDELPQLDFAGHVYSDEPSQRLIMINSKIAREGDVVTSKLHLEEITPNGVILRHHSTRFRMILF